MPKVLVIDDDATIRVLLENLLALEGHHVILASDGESGLRRVEEEQPDLVVLDVMMPGMDGFEVLSRLRERPGPPLPVVMLTAMIGDADVWRAWAGGVSSFVAKPFDPMELITQIGALCAGQPLSA